ncbi:Cell number regulator 6 [Hordeum vulgare]|nr:Cell number regulator 6 [Hordeum vulgare]
MRLKSKIGYKRSDDIKTKDMWNIFKDLVKDDKNGDLALHVFYPIVIMKVVIPRTSTRVSREASMVENLVSEDMPQMDYCQLLVDDLKRVVIRSKVMFRNNECEATVDDAASSFGPRRMLRSNVAEDKILRGQFDARVRKFFNATRPNSMDAHDSVIFPTFHPPDVPTHMGGVGHWVSIFLDLKNDRFRLLHSYYGPSNDCAVRRFWKMPDNIKKL